MSLLNADPRSGHTALDTLARILTEGMVRANSRLVRGDRPVICWSARPPRDLAELRRWNPALIRWTMEPYGIAVDRSVLKERGAKPVVYARSACYFRLPPPTRFRFQRHEPPHCNWKREREWRLVEDLMLAGIPSNRMFVFVPDPNDLADIARHLASGPPVVVLPAAADERR
jgi:hypothetical protein